jgi:acyl dehydratase
MLAPVEESAERGVPTGWEGVAFNQASASENRIHADDVARQYGFRGGLVPGVTVYAYLVHPAVVAWGEDWLARGRAHLELKKPLYDGSAFRVEVHDATTTQYAATLLDADGTPCAVVNVELPPVSPSTTPTLRGDRPVPPPDARPPGTLVTMERLQREGMGALRVQWNGDGELDRYTRELSGMPHLVRPDGAGRANPAFLLGLANSVLARNVELSPWIHTDSDVQHRAPVALGDWLVVEAAVTKLFERRGNRFVDLAICVHGGRGPVLLAQHRAIYELGAR